LGVLTEERIPASPRGFDDATGQPRTWPMRLAKAHWAALLPGFHAAGKYTLCRRTIDEKGLMGLGRT